MNPISVDYCTDIGHAYLLPFAAGSDGDSAAEPVLAAADDEV